MKTIDIEFTRKELIQLEKEAKNFGYPKDKIEDFINDKFLLVIRQDLYEEISKMLDIENLNKEETERFLNLCEQYFDQLSRAKIHFKGEIKTVFGTLTKLSEILLNAGTTTPN